MKTVILCGGLGTRLREETEYRPKPMVPIGPRPILWHIMKFYACQGLDDFVLCLGYKGDVIRDYFLRYDLLHADITVNLGSNEIVRHACDAHDEHGWRVTLAETGLATMTGGRVRRIQKYINGDTFMLTYGDGLSNVDLKDLLRFHHEMRRAVTVTAVHPPARFGELAVAGDLALSFQEKPQVQTGWINGGFFVCNRAIFDYLQDDADVLERQPLERLAHDGQLAVYRHEGHWRCMDTLRDMEVLNNEWASGAACWKIW